MLCRVQSYLDLDHLSYIFLSAETSGALGLPWESIWIWRGGGASQVVYWKSPPPSKSWDAWTRSAKRLELRMQPGLRRWRLNSVCSLISRQLLGLVSCPSLFLVAFIVYLHTSSGARAWLDTEMEIMQVHSVVCTFASRVSSSKPRGLPL